MERVINALKPRWKSFQLSLFLIRRNVLTRTAMIVVLILLLIALLAPVIAPYPGDFFDDTHPTEMLQPPSKEHWFGTDDLGRDILSRILYGTRISITSATYVVVFSFVIGASLGAIAGSVGGWVDEIIMRIADIFLSFPGLLLAVFFATLMGPSLRNAQIALVISWWPWYTRYMRGQAIAIKERPFVKAADAIGTSKLKIIFRHIFPNGISPLIIQATMDMGGVILQLASMSFLGLGAQAPTPEWGLMINTSKTYFLSAWWYGVFPGVAVFITVLSLNLFGEGLREIMDPKTRKL